MTITAGRQCNKIIAELYIINEVVNAYHEGKFKEMKCLILDYGEEEFFTDLFQYLENETWRRPFNKYLIFVGITRQFFKIYT